MPLEPGKALVVLVGDDQSVENRVIDLPPGLPPSALIEAANYLNAHIRGLTLGEAQRQHRAAAAHRQGRARRADAERVIEAGLADLVGLARRPQEPDRARPGQPAEGRRRRWRTWSASASCSTTSRRKRDLVQLLGLAERGDGVRIFIGSENKLFSLSGSSLIVAPFQDERRKVVGVLGVIGPTRLNYARIIPMVDYTAKLVSRLLT